ncbi:MAG: ZIP family metal transporter [Oscillospiraceae bacterium]|nr:ZIP family metal transporter [Oscillospiraceae bacterium]
MTLLTVQGLLVPLFGTTFGAACVLFMKKYFSIAVQRGLMGFAAGVMVAASVWSLLIPSIDQSQHLGKLAFIPAVSGFCIGMISLMLTDKVTDKLQKSTQKEENSYFRKTTMLVIAVVLHNIPEGMAVGAVYANALATKENAAFSAAFVLAMGIAIQNLPEGAIISMPLAARGMSKGKAFFNGILSGVVEPVAGLLTILLSALIIPVLPYLLAFAAGAMIYVVVKELVPEISEGKHADSGILMFMLGFSVMMALDVALG